MTASSGIGPTVKLFYGLGAVAFGVLAVALGSLLMLFFNQVIGLPAPWVGAAIMISLVLDAVCDPLIGQWSDHLESRWGRRHPFMYACAIPLAIAVYLLWNPPHGWSNHIMFGYLLVILVATRLLFSLYEVPSTALAPELTGDYDERTSLLSYRFFFGNLGGTAMALLVFRVFLRKDATHPLGVLYRHGYEQFGLVAALVMLVTILVSAFGTHGRGAASSQRARERISLADQVRQMMTTLSNRSFVSLTVAGIFGGVAGGLVGGLELYIASYFWELSSREISYFAVLGFVCAILAVAAAPAVAKRMDKKRATITLLCMSLVGVFPMPLRLVGLMPPNHSFALLAILLIEAFIQNTLSIMALIIASSMMADVVEDVAVSSGQYSAGLLFAANGLVQKCVLGIGTFAAGLLLEFVHFPQGATQSHVDPAVLRHLALVFIPLTVGCGAIGIACLTFYRIDRVGHQRNLDILRDAAAATENRGVEGVEVKAL